MAVIEEVHEPTQPQPRYTGPAKPVMMQRRKPAPAPAGSAAAQPGASLAGGLSLADPVGSVQLLLFDRNYWHILAGLLLLGECVLCGLIIRFVSCKLSAGLSSLRAQAAERVASIACRASDLPQACRTTRN
jgi:hypothetical protein